MYRTDKQFMKNPATAAQRIYIGGLNKTVIADDLEEKFRVHGNILGLVLNSGFAFIQYETEFEAQSAIHAENGSIMHGRKIMVKQALDKSKTHQNQNQQQNKPFQNQQQQNQIQKPSFQQPNSNPSPMGQQLPKQNNAMSQRTPPPPQNVPQPPRMDMEAQKMQQSLLEQDFQDDSLEDERPVIRPPAMQINQANDDRGRKPIRKGPIRGPSNERRLENRFNRYEQCEDIYYSRNYVIDTTRPLMPPYAPPIMDAAPILPEKNDCEIIVVSKALTEYAEFIEQKLKNKGLIVDLLFPNEDVPIGKVLANISSRGCLYAILVMPQNEENRSLTLNVLHGIPQEHRNMPIEDALIFISCNFESYMKGEQAAPDNSVQTNLNDRHPTPMQMMFNLLAENRQLTSVQYDRLIKYLRERRELQHEYEVAEGIEPDSQESDMKQAELQSRIMNILNKTESVPASITSSEKSDSVAGQAPILKDPTVQKALDSLMLGDMFKNIGSG